MSLRGLDLALEILTERFLYDQRGRIAGTSSDGKPPLFVWLRFAESSLWRFRSDASDSCIAEVAKLAGREKGWSLMGETTPPPPERLEMIRRILAKESPSLSLQHEVVRDPEPPGLRPVVEIWNFIDA